MASMSWPHTVRQTRRAPSPRRGEGWGEGVTIYREVRTPSPDALRASTSPQPNSGLPEFGSIERPKSDISDFGWGEVEPAARGIKQYIRGACGPFDEGPHP